MLKSKKKSDQELMQTREHNVKNWTDEDYLFYEDFFNSIDEVENSSTLDKSVSEKMITEGWKDFKQLIDKNASVT